MAGEEGKSPRELRLTHHRSFLLSCIGHGHDEKNGLHYTTSTGLKQSDTALHPERSGVGSFERSGGDPSKTG